MLQLGSALPIRAIASKPTSQIRLPSLILRTWCSRVSWSPGASGAGVTMLPQNPSSASEPRPDSRKRYATRFRTNPRPLTTLHSNPGYSPMASDHRPKTQGNRWGTAKTTSPFFWYYRDVPEPLHAKGVMPFSLPAPCARRPCGRPCRPGAAGPWRPTRRSRR